MAVIYVAALLTSLPVLGGVAVYMYDNHTKSVEQREKTQAAAVEAAKSAASGLEQIIGLASAIFRARYHLSSACNPYFRDPDFFKLNPGESCAPQLLHSVFELDQEIVALAYQLDVIPAIGSETRGRFDSLNTHYWAQAGAAHAAIGYRQRIVDSLHAAHDFKGQRPLRDCGPIGFDGLDVAGCEATLQHLKSVSLVHIQRQMDAILCSIVQDIRALRGLAQEATVSRETELGKRILSGEVSEVCKKKLRETPVTYVYE